jgi:hypothetical protein
MQVQIFLRVTTWLFETSLEHTKLQIYVKSMNFDPYYILLHTLELQSASFSSSSTVQFFFIRVELFIGHIAEQAVRVEGEHIFTGIPDGWDSTLCVSF